MTAIALLSTGLVQASPASPLSKKCKRGEGAWEKSDGEVVCFKCPDTSLFFEGRDLKLPQGCRTGYFGVFLSLNSYQGYVEAMNYSAQAQAFIEGLEPALNRLTEQSQIAQENLEIWKANESKLLERAVNSELELKELKGELKSWRLFTFILSGVVGASIVIGTSAFIVKL